MNTFLNNKWLISLTAGIFLGLSFPPFDLTFLSFPAFMLLFFLIEQCDSKKQVAYYSYLGFLMWNIITTYWLMMASVGAGVAAILANSVLMTIPLCLGFHFRKKFKSPFIVAFLQASAWVGYEYLHHNWDLAWPWIAVGNAWSNQVSLIQFISVTGHLGISFWVAITAALAVQAIRLRTKTLAYASVASLLILPACSLAWFALDTQTAGSESTDAVKIAVIQPNHDSYEDYGGMSGSREVLDSLFSISTKTIAEDTDLIIWPENAIDKPILMNSVSTLRISDSARVWNKNFVIGTGIIETYTQQDKPKLIRGTYRGEPFNIFNGALFVDKDGVRTRYDKAKLVPIVERIPFVNFLNTIDIFNWVEWGALAGFGRGNEPTMIKTSSFTSPGLVCYDSVYPTWIRKFVNEGADFITIITNDGWWGNSSGHVQHFSYARLRAIEFDRWVVRSANNGTSGIIRPDGTIEQKTEYWVRTGFTSSIPKLTHQTVYARFGDWLSYLCLFLVSGSWIGSFFLKKSTETE